LFATRVPPVKRDKEAGPPPALPSSRTAGREKRVTIKPQEKGKASPDVRPQSVASSGGKKGKGGSSAVISSMKNSTCKARKKNGEKATLTSVCCGNEEAHFVSSARRTGVMPWPISPHPIKGGGKGSPWPTPVVGGGGEKSGRSARRPTKSLLFCLKKRRKKGRKKQKEHCCCGCTKERRSGDKPGKEGYTEKRELN